MVKIPLPPDSYDQCYPLVYVLKPGTLLYRIFVPEPYKNTPLTFRHFGPKSRFDHHNFSLTKPQNDPHRGILYAAFTFSGCFVEVFGDQKVVSIKELDQCQIAELAVDGELKLIDLRKNGAMLVGANATLAKVADRKISQSWSKYLYNYRDQFAGLIYYNAHNDEEAIALYERASSSISTNLTTSLSLSDPLLRDVILEIAKDHNLYIAELTG